MLRTASYAAAVALTLAAGFVSGTWRGRWAGAGTASERLAPLSRLPLEVAGWEGRDSGIDQREIRAAGVYGGVLRRYENPRYGAATVLLVCGPPGPTSVHTPEVCYAGAGYRATTGLKAVPADPEGKSGDRLWVIDFEKQGVPEEERLRVYYAWSRGQGWKASDNPRGDFAGASALYKLYLVERVAPGSAPGGGGGAALRLARDLLPELNKRLPPV